MKRLVSLLTLITLSAYPQRIVSLAPSNTEILFAVGAGDAVVGVTSYCDYPPKAQEREQIGGYAADSISVETIVALEPDLVVATGNPHAKVIEALDQVGILVISFSASDFEGVYATIELAGQVTGHEEQAAQIVKEMQGRVDAVQHKVATLPQDERLTVFWEIWDEPLMTTGPSTFTGQMIEMAGGINIFAGLDQEYPSVSVENVIDQNPSVIMSSDTHGDKMTLDQVAGRPGWDQLDAVKNGRIHLIDGNIVSRPGPRLVDAVEAIAQALYPELFE